LRERSPSVRTSLDRTDLSDWDGIALNVGAYRDTETDRADR
jgi:hypothetical protein